MVEIQDFIDKRPLLLGSEGLRLVYPKYISIIYYINIKNSSDRHFYCALKIASCHSTQVQEG